MMKRIAAVVSIALVLGGCDTFNAKLPDGEVDAANTCWPVASAVGQQDKAFSLAEMGEIMAYAAIAAKGVAGNQSFPDKMATVTNTPVKDQAKLGINADSLLTQCRGRFPAAAGTTPVTPPNDPIDHGMWCLIASDFMTGSMTGGKVDNYPEKDRLARVKKTAVDSLKDDLLATRGITSAEQFDAYRDKLTPAVMVNRLDKIAAACPDG